MEIWKRDVGDYLTLMSDGNADKITRHNAYLALMGIINLIELSEEE